MSEEAVAVQAGEPEFYLLNTQRKAGVVLGACHPVAEKPET